MKRPSAVTIAFWLTLIKTVLGIAVSGFVLVSGALLLGNAALTAGGAYTAQFATAIAAVVLNGAMILLACIVWKGRNWARITLLIVAILGVVLSLTGLLVTTPSAIEVVIGAIGIALGIAIIALLGSPTARAFTENR